MAVNRKAWLSKCFEGPGGSVSWVVLFRRSLHQFENDEYKALLSLLSNVFIFSYARILRTAVFGRLSSLVGLFRRLWKTLRGLELQAL